MKTGFLELRPIFVRKESRTRGHVFAAMLALKVVREGERGLKESTEALTLDGALSALSRLCFQRQEIGGQEVLHLPRPDARQTAIFAAWGITPPPPHGPPKLTCRQRCDLASTINSSMTARS